MAPDPWTSAKPETRKLYHFLLSSLARVGEFTEDPKKTSIHLVRKTAFAGVRPRKEHLVLTIKASRAIHSPRIFKSEQVSKSRWHHEVRLREKAEVDRELIAWLAEGYDLSG